MSAWLRRLGTAALVAAAVAWLVLLRPTALGGPGSYIVISGTSMLPSFHGGDLVVARQAAAYRVGDVVAYRIPAGGVGGGRLVIHRVVGGSAARGYLLKGDNRAFADPWRPTVSEIEGKALAVAPRVGYALVFLRSPLGLATIAGVLTLALLWGAPRRRPLADHDAAPGLEA